MITLERFFAHYFYGVPVNSKKHIYHINGKHKDCNPGNIVPLNLEDLYMIRLYPRKKRSIIARARREFPYVGPSLSKRDMKKIHDQGGKR